MGTWVVYGYWDVTQLRDVFNAVAALMSTGSYANIMMSMIMLGGMAIVGGAMARVRGEEPFIWMVAMVIIYEALVVPKVTVVIQDSANIEAPATVSNVPMGLAFLASTITTIGEWATTTYETLFTIPSNLDFSQRGLDFGEAALSDTVNSVVMDPNFSNDLLNYVQNCVAPDLLDGSKNLTTLMTSEDVWSYMGNPNPARYVYLVEQNAVVSCLDAYNYLNGIMPGEVNQSLNQVARAAYPNLVQNNAPQPILNGYLLGDLPAAANTVMQVTSTNATNMIRQGMMVNLWQRVPQALSSAVNDTVGAQVAEGTSQAEASSMASSYSMVTMAAQALPAIHNTMEIFIIAMFPIIILLVVMGGKNSGKLLMGYVIALLWVELWPMGYAVVNYILISGAFGDGGVGAAMSAGLIGPPTSTGLTIMNAIPVQSALLHGQAMAGMYVLFVPPAIFGLVAGSAIIFSNTMPTLIGSMMSSAQASGGQAGLGNVSMGQTNYDNLTAMNTHQGSYRTKPTIEAGAVGGGGGINLTDPSMGTNTSAAGRVITGTDSQGNPMAVGQANLDSFGLGVGAVTSRSVSAAQNSGTSTTAGADSSVTVDHGQATNYTQQDIADWNRTLAQKLAQEQGWSKVFGNTSTAGGGTSAQTRTATGDNRYQGEDNKTDGKVGVGAEAGTGFMDNKEQTARTPAPRSYKTLDGKPIHSSLLSQFEQAESTATGFGVLGLIDDAIKTTRIGKGNFGANFNAGLTQDSSDSSGRKLTSGAEGSTASGTSREEMQKEAMDAVVKALAATTDAGQRLAGMKFLGDLGNHFGWKQSQMRALKQQVTAGDTKSTAQSNAMQASVNLDAAAVPYMMSRNPGMTQAQAVSALDSMTQNPGTRMALAGNVVDWLNNSQEGQAWMQQQGLEPPMTQGQVRQIGIAQEGNLLAQGRGAVAATGHANLSRVQGMQPFSAQSGPDLSQTQQAVQGRIQAVQHSFASAVEANNFNRGAELLTASIMNKQNGMGTELNSFFLGGVGQTDREKVMDKINTAALSDPRVKTAVEHLGTQDQPTAGQYQGVADFVELGYRQAETASEK